jgi:hypothetical protein
MGTRPPIRALRLSLSTRAARIHPQLDQLRAPLPSAAALRRAALRRAALRRGALPRVVLARRVVLLPRVVLPRRVALPWAPRRVPLA